MLNVLWLDKATFIYLCNTLDLDDGMTSELRMCPVPSVPPMSAVTPVIVSSVNSK